MRVGSGASGQESASGKMPNGWLNRMESKGQGRPLLFHNISMDLTVMHLRWMIRRDLSEVAAIDEATLVDNWTEEDYSACLRQRNTIGMVVEIADLVAGFIIYELHRNRLHITRIAVDPAFQGKAVGRTMVERLINKLHEKRRTTLNAYVPERELDAQLFLKALGFKATATFDDYYGRDNAAYFFQFHVSQITALENATASVPA